MVTKPRPILKHKKQNHMENLKGGGCGCGRPKGGGCGRPK